MKDNRSSQGDSWLDGFVPYQLYRITNRLNQRLRERLRQLPISVSRWRVLGVLRAQGTLTINAIAEAAAMEQPTVSRTVTRLVRDGLVSRRAAKRDSRYMEVSLTAAGQSAFDTIYPIAEEHQTAALRGFNERELATLHDYLQRIQRNIADDTDLRATGN
ncbi:MAG: MarR family winged helix-turn-helix transcriptional regulator [Gammaproteobacteria bacterium]